MKNSIGFIAYPKVVEYRYKLFGFIPCRRMTIVNETLGGKSLEELVTEKTGRKKITIIEHT
jgi:hypothetical protein|nr:hypothetical protein [Bacteroides intestinalis]DAY77061.1 MAG TPA: hypothetical protein [Caudoviricetes sp.]